MKSQNILKTMYKPVDVLIEAGDWVRIEAPANDTQPTPYIVEGTTFYRTAEEWGRLGQTRCSGIYLAGVWLSHSGVKLLEIRPSSESS